MPYTYTKSIISNFVAARNFTYLFCASWIRSHHVLVHVARPAINCVMDGQRRRELCALTRKYITYHWRCNLQWYALWLSRQYITATEACVVNCSRFYITCTGAKKARNHDPKNLGGWATTYFSRIGPYISITVIYKNAVLLQGNCAMPQLFFSV